MVAVVAYSVGKAGKGPIDQHNSDLNAALNDNGDGNQNAGSSNSSTTTTDDGSQSDGGDNGGDDGGCFVPGSLVVLGDGKSTRAIETIRPGERVLSRNKSDGTPAPDVVKRTHSALAKSTVKLTLSDGTKLELTSRQKIFLRDGSKISAGRITKGTQVRTLSNEVITVVSAQQLASQAIIHWFELENKQPAFLTTARMETSTDPIDKGSGDDSSP